ncbi:hypothetical protein GS597_13440 [Synechococcales cyanobacterium C]|uniref:Sortilin N-terminal domain-containing protein n=1 Tax=Petrachloros mirabilis ULC683 TaxID=2781853 RepID=A0A8K2A0S4_9CYAN|nr:hypothetical protein [Petrachloros mirabilis]NCJ07493.1 hypothetical protein [Petrachloros mirabilis ULC683]
MAKPKQSRMGALLRPLQRRKILKILGLFLLVWVTQLCLSSGCQPHASFQVSAAQVQFSPRWVNVDIGGGGYVTGIAVPSQAPDAPYLRTDIGGFFRWEPSAQRWQPLSDQFNLEQKNLYGGEALAIDPHNPEIVYIAAGLYLSWGSGGLFKSTDGGQTWVRSDLAVPMGGSEAGRWSGQRLAIDPFDSNRLFFGSRQDGLWRSEDGGLTWQSVSSFAVEANPTWGVSVVAFDPQRRDRIYASAYEDGLYQSEDGGATWQKLGGCPTEILKLAVAATGRLYITNNARPWVSRYQGGTCQNITPPHPTSTGFNALAVRPDHPEQVAIVEQQTASPLILRSQDSGQSWERLNSQVQNRLPWLPNRFFGDHTADLQWDSNNRLWLTDWFSIWRTDPLEGRTTTWRNLPWGHEQIVTFSILAPPTGALLISGIADMDGFYHHRLDQFPQRRLGYSANPQDAFQDTYSLAYSAQHPESWVRVAGDRWRSRYGGATSQDGGQTWRQFPTFPSGAIPQRVAVSATQPDRFVITIQEGTALRSSNGGQTWQTVTGLPPGNSGPWNWTQPLAADSVNGQSFYYYHQGTLYRSDNGGLSFQPINTTLPTEDRVTLVSVPHQAGELWLACENHGLYHSTNAGQSFTATPTLTQARLFALGRPLEAGQAPALYAMGALSTQESGIFLSLDSGQTWHNISESDRPIGTDPNVMAASQQQFGLVFVGTTGRGIFYKHIDPGTLPGTLAHSDSSLVHRL